MSLSQSSRKARASSAPCGVARAVLQVVDVAAELVQAADAPCAAARCAASSANSASNRLSLYLAGELAEAGQRLVADAALGRGHRAQEGRVVVVVDQQAQPGAQVLDLGAVEEALAARHLVRDLRLAQRLLEHPGLVVGAVQHREVVPLHLRPAVAPRAWPGCAPPRARPRAPRCRSRPRAPARLRPARSTASWETAWGWRPITLLAARRMALVER